MQVKDVMHKEIDSLGPFVNALAALQTIMDKHISGLPVIDNEGRLCGMFTEKEILKTIMPGYIEKVGKMLYTGYDKTIKKLQELKQLSVKDIMRTDVVTTNPDVSLAEIARLMLTQKIRRIPVIKDNKVVGIVAREDVVKTFAKDAGIIQ